MIFLPLLLSYSGNASYSSDQVPLLGIALPVSIHVPATAPVFGLMVPIYVLVP